MDEEIRKEFDMVWNRIDRLEKNKMLDSTNKFPNQPASSKKMKGIQCGVQEIIDEGFFNKPRSTAETNLELERKGHFGDLKRISTVIRRDFFQKRKILTRVKENGKWKYVLIK